jgi:hypothetical protein
MTRCRRRIAVRLHDETPTRFRAIKLILYAVANLAARSALRISYDLLPA